MSGMQKVATVGGTSRAEGIIASIRADILSGRLEPARRLTFPELCAAYSVSVGVLREALVRLVDSGIVRAESNLGFRVMSLTTDDLLDLTATRALLEPDFVGAAVRSGPMQWEADLVASHHLLARTPMSREGALNDQWVTSHAAFHLALVSGAGNRRMLEIVRRLRDEADLYRRWYLHVDLVQRHEGEIADQHRQLLDAALAREAERAEDLMRSGIEGATTMWLASQAMDEQLLPTGRAQRPVGR